MIDERPFENIRVANNKFVLPRRKWRELLFVGSIVADGDDYVRDPSRPMAQFRDPNLFPEGVRFRIHDEDGDTVVVERIP